MVTLEYYTYGNGTTVSAVLNAIATFFNSSTFNSLIAMSSMIAVVLTTGYFFITRNPAHIYKFAAVFFLVPLTLINLKARMQVIDLTESNVHSVDNVPYLVAIPTYFSTTFMYGFTSSVETIFSSDLSATEEYGKTGMTFGSSLFRLSSKSTLSDITVKQLWSDFFNNCIVRDITINNKYTWEQLYSSSDIWTFLKAQTMSPLRGIYVATNNYKTCAEALPVMEDKFRLASNADLVRLGQYIFGDQYQAKAGLLDSSLTDSYQRYASISENSSNIIKQNMTMNAIRNGVNDLGGTAGALNYAYTQNKSQTTAMWASIALQAKEFIPMMHTILFLLFGCASIFVAAVAMIPTLTVMVLTNYVKTFATLAIWPALFAFLNFLMTTSLSQTTSGVTNLLNGVTLSNNNALDEMHTRFGLIAGYLMMSIPFLAGSIIKGGAAVMSNLSYQLSGMINSTNARTSAAASSGDLGPGSMRVDNQSHNNLSARKFNDTLLHREGGDMSSPLGRVGGSTTEGGNGSQVYGEQSTYSNLGYSTGSQNKVSQSINPAYTEQQTISNQQMAQLSETTSTGVSMGERLTKSSLDSKSNHSSYATADAVSINQGVDKMGGAVESVMENTGWTEDKSKSYVHSVSAGLGANTGSPADFDLAKESASASTTWSRDDTELFTSMGSTREEDVKTALLQYRDGANMVSDAAGRTDTSSGNLEQVQNARDFGENWNTTKTQAQAANQSYSKTESLATALNASRSLPGSVPIGENMVDGSSRSEGTQLAQAQKNINDDVSYFSDRVSNGELLFNQNQHDTFNTKIGSTEQDINGKKEANPSSALPTVKGGAPHSAPSNDEKGNTNPVIGKNENQTEPIAEPQFNTDGMLASTKMMVPSSSSEPLTLTQYSDEILSFVEQSAGVDVNNTDNRVGRVDDLLSNPNLSTTQKEVLSQISQFEQGLAATDFAPDESMGKRGFQLYDQLSDSVIKSDGADGIDPSVQASSSNNDIGAKSADLDHSAGSAVGRAQGDKVLSGSSGIGAKAAGLDHSAGGAVGRTQGDEVLSSNNSLEATAAYFANEWLRGGKAGIDYAKELATKGGTLFDDRVDDAKELATKGGALFDDRVDDAKELATKGKEWFDDRVDDAKELATKGGTLFDDRVDDAKELATKGGRLFDDRVDDVKELATKGKEWVDDAKELATKGGTLFDDRVDDAKELALSTGELIKDSANDAKTHMTNGAMKYTEHLLQKDLGNDEDGYRDLTTGELTSAITQVVIDPMGDVANSMWGKASNEITTNLIDEGEVIVALGVSVGASAGAGADGTAGEYIALNLRENWVETGTFWSVETSVNAALPAPEVHGGGVGFIYGSSDAQKVFEGRSTSVHADVDMGVVNASIGVVETNYNNYTKHNNTEDSKIHGLELNVYTEAAIDVPGTMSMSYNAGQGWFEPNDRISWGNK